ncbi:MAG TPA: PIN domain-containing protein [Bacteroidales bacterium]|nr:PIN domain-containing protein [Bacteroidales bacterium]
MEFLIDSCFVQDINPQIKTLTKEIMQNQSVKVPDAIVSASAIYLDMPLFTFDTDFKRIDGLELLLLE